MNQLFRVQNADLRARVALQALERWPLPACRDLLEFCMNDRDTDAALRAELELRKKELDVYHWVRAASSCQYLDDGEPLIYLKKSLFFFALADVELQHSAAVVNLAGDEERIKGQSGVSFVGDAGSKSGSMSCPRQHNSAHIFYLPNSAFILI